MVPRTSRIKSPKQLFKRPGRYTFISPTPHATFQCRIDKGAWRACSSPCIVRPRKVRRGKHKLHVRAVLRHADGLV